MKSIAILSLGTALCAASASYASDSCEVKSGPSTAALVELYTSEGCSSCPPADRQLSNLRGQLAANAVLVPLALHVSYWDQIGWKDPFAQKKFDERQTQLLEKRRNKVLYTPQFFVNGEELRNWGNALPAEIRRTNAKKAPLTITLKSRLSNGQPNLPEATAGSTLTLEAHVSATDPGTDGALYLVLSESGLVSQVLRGENRGSTLKHDDVARLWLGPFPLVQGTANVRQVLSLPATWQREYLQALAFVRSSDDARVLQAVSTAQCLPATPVRSL